MKENKQNGRYKGEKSGKRWQMKIKRMKIKNNREKTYFIKQKNKWKVRKQ